MTLRVLVVDDSAVIRRALAIVIETTPGLLLVGSASNGRLGLAAIERERPDAVVLDVEMPELDGFAVLEALRQLRPRPLVLMFSRHAEHGTTTALKALSMGAVDCVQKPDLPDIEGNLQFLRSKLVPRLLALRARRAAQHAHTVTTPRPLAAPAPAAPPQAARGTPLSTNVAALRRGLPNDLGPLVFTHTTGPTLRPEARAFGELRPIDLVAVAVSTGGPKALLEILPALPESFPVPILIVQHMPATFTERLAALLGHHCRLPVAEATPNVPLPRTGILIAPGGVHLVVRRRERALVLETNNDPPENGCRPAADVLFRSCAAVFGPRVLGLILTGMGADGLAGSRALVAGGARVVVQDKATSTVWGMAGVVAGEGLADATLPLSAIADDLLRRAAIGRGFAGRSS